MIECFHSPPYSEFGLLVLGLDLVPHVEEEGHDAVELTQVVLRELQILRRLLPLVHEVRKGDLRRLAPIPSLLGSREEHIHFGVDCDIEQVLVSLGPVELDADLEYFVDDAGGLVVGGDRHEEPVRYEPRVDVHPLDDVVENSILQSVSGFQNLWQVFAVRRA